jgi:hypothetical protein
MMRAVDASLQIIKQHRQAYFLLNVAFYGVLLSMMIVAAIFPNLRSLAQASTDPNSDPLNWLFVGTYGEGKVVTAAVITFIVNLVAGAVITQSMSSLVVPFCGVAFGFVRVAGWGLIFAPSSSRDLAWAIPHMAAAIVEGQAYVVAALAAWIHGRKYLYPRKYGELSHWAGYKAGIVDTARLYPLIIVMLAAAAVCEAIELIYIVPDAFLQWWLGH